MTLCADLEPLLFDYRNLSATERERVDAHVASCADCRETLKALSYLEDELSEVCSAIDAPAEFRNMLRSRVALEKPVRGPSVVPEILDFLGWSAIFAVAVVVAGQVNVLPFEGGAPLLCVSVGFLWAIRFSLRVRAELKH